MSVERKLQKELEITKSNLERLKYERDSLTKVIWDMLNYASPFVVLLDSQMYVTLANWSLATKLGFSDEKEIVGKCWLDFIKEEEKEMIKQIHYSISTDDEKGLDFKEVMNDIVSLSGEIITVKWFNIRINHEYNMTFSFGLKMQPVVEREDEESIRAYYRDIIEKDKTMIKVLRDSALNVNIRTTCGSLFEKVGS